MKKTLLYALSLTVAGALAGCSQADSDNSSESAASRSAAEETTASDKESSSPDSGTSNPSGAAEAVGGNKPAGEGSDADTAFDEEAARKKLLEAIDYMTSYTMTYQLGDNSAGSDSWLEEYTFTQELAAEFDGERLASWETNRRDPIPGTGEVVLKDSMRFIAKNANLSPAGSSPELVEGAVPSGIAIPPRLGPRHLRPGRRLCHRLGTPHPRLREGTAPPRRLRHQHYGLHRRGHRSRHTRRSPQVPRRLGLPRDQRINGREVNSCRRLKQPLRRVCNERAGGSPRANHSNQHRGSRPPGPIKWRGTNFEEAASVHICQAHEVVHRHWCG